ncbi:ABC transporter permease [Pedobacter duraquae]|uniref:Lipoprotein-releasing system permease protein n=1 Tax=Pedobacter duraquae TaxID=425511 RepID=A0A4R6ICN8_9SPHI|nr:ABC transporter permease [Pedobacter duraquae]TDO20030.1 lipoprotein-releasing system permease protein [Pedobacter duraquae]
MNTPFYIAKRYLFAKKSTNAINIISTISMVGVLVGSAALIIILTVFNGFGEMVLKMFNTITPQIVIAPVKGKTFDPGLPYFQQLKKDKRIYSYTEVLMENALLVYNNRQSVSMVKGVSDNYLRNKSLDTITVLGKFILHNKNGSQAVIGSAIQSYLYVNVNDPFVPLQIFSPKKDLGKGSIIPGQDLTMKTIPVAGVFEVQQDFDNLTIVPLDFARKLLDEPKEVSSIEINLNKGLDADDFKAVLEEKLGDQFYVKNRIEQNQILYNILGTEKWAVYIILTFIVIIAIFNIIGSLTMLVLDKLKDIAILRSLGAGKTFIKRIFLLEGMMITMAGCVLGLAVGFLFCLGQQKYGWVKMTQDIRLPNAYPIAFKWTDFLLVFITVCIFSFVASALSARLSVKKINHINQDL